MPRKKSAALPAKTRASAPVAAPAEATPLRPAVPSREKVAARAAEIWRETGGSPFENWIRAERELGA